MNENKFSFRGFFEGFDFADLTGALLSLYGFNLYSSDVIASFREQIGGHDNFYLIVLAVYFAIPVVVALGALYFVNTSQNGYTKFLLENNRRAARWAAYILPLFFIGYYVVCYKSDFKIPVASWYWYTIVCGGAGLAAVPVGYQIFQYRISGLGFKFLNEDQRAELRVGIKHFYIVVCMITVAFFILYCSNREKILAGYKDYLERIGQVKPSANRDEESIRAGDLAFVHSQSVKNSDKIVNGFIDMRKNMEGYISSSNRIDTLYTTAMKEIRLINSRRKAKERKQIITSRIKSISEEYHEQARVNKLPAQKRKLKNKYLVDSTYLAYQQYDDEMVPLRCYSGTAAIDTSKNIAFHQLLDQICELRRERDKKWSMIVEGCKNYKGTSEIKIVTASIDDETEMPMYLKSLLFNDIVAINTYEAKVYFGLRVGKYLIGLNLLALLFAFFWLDSYLVRTRLSIVPMYSTGMITTPTLAPKASDDNSVEAIKLRFSETALTKVGLFAILVCLVPVFSSSLAFSIKEPFLGRSIPSSIALSGNDIRMGVDDIYYPDAPSVDPIDYERIEEMVNSARREIIDKGDSNTKNIIRFQDGRSDYP